MTRITFFLFLLIISLNCVSQNWFIDFESPQTQIWVDSNATDSLWQIGIPQKNILDSAYSPVNAIITDTINPYSINENASFIVEYYLGGSYPSVSFRHRYSMDSLHSVGYVQVSSNGGDNWATVYGQLYYEPWFGSNTQMDSAMLEAAVYGVYTFDDWYGMNDTVFDQYIGFSGNSNGWKYSTISFPCFAIKQNQQYLLRFTFVSDSLAAPMDGWIIDNISVDNSGICSSIDEHDITFVKTFPNPSNNEITIEIMDNRLLSGIDYAVYDISGKNVLQVANYSGQQIILDKSEFGNGIFFLRIKKNGIVYANEKIIFID